MVQYLFGSFTENEEVEAFNLDLLRDINLGRKYGTVTISNLIQDTTQKQVNQSLTQQIRI